MNHFGNTICNIKNLSLFLILFSFSCQNKISPIQQTIDINKKVNKSLKEEKIQEKIIENIKKEDNPTVKEVQISDKTLTINLGKKAFIKANVIKSDSNMDTSIIWTSENPDVANVNNGEISPLKKGQTIIKAVSLEDQKKFNYCLVIITDIENSEVSSVKINNNEQLAHNLYENSTVILSATVKYKDGTYNNKVLWKSSDTSIADIDKIGNIFFKNFGIVTITAYSTDKINISDVITLKVNKR